MAADSRFADSCIASIVVGELYGAGAPRGDEPVVRDLVGIECRVTLVMVAGEYDVRCVVREERAGADAYERVESIEIDWTRPNFGGRRAWFLCAGCGVHRRELHLARLYDHFRCSRCLGRTYRSTRMSPSERKREQARKLRAELGGFDPDFPVKPKGQHWSTFRRKVDELLLLEEEINAERARRMGAALAGRRGGDARAKRAAGGAKRVGGGGGRGPDPFEVFVYELEKAVAASRRAPDERPPPSRS